MCVRKLLAGRAPAPTIRPEASVDDLIHHLARHDAGAAVVSADETSVDGLVSERDVVRALRDGGPALLRQPVSEIMTAKPPVVDAHDCYVSALGLMLDRKLRHLPVVENGRYAGLVSIRDIAQRRMDEVLGEAEAMRHYIDGA